MTVLSTQDLDIASLPPTEDERFEYKSSKVSSDELRIKLGRAASGFWNSGGGTFIAGVDGKGKPDGGLPPTVGRTPIRDWVDQVLREAAPVGHYAVRLFNHDPASALNIAPNHCILAVGFGESSRPPHMAPDSRYYLRAGVHTLPATHYLVEALWAKRTVQRPQLAHSLRLKPEVSGVIQLIVLALTEQPALNVTVSLNPLPGIWKDSKSLPVKLPALDRTTPFYLDVSTFAAGDRQLEGVQLRVEYEDLARNRYEYSAALDISAIAPWTLGTPASEKMAKSFESIEKSLRVVPKALEGLQREGAELRGQFEALSWAAFPRPKSDPSALAERLTTDAAALMREAASDGTISFRAHLGGVQLFGGGHSFISDSSDVREEARWRSVISELRYLGLADGVFQDRGGGLFQLTKLGYEVADAIKGKGADGLVTDAGPGG